VLSNKAVGHTSKLSLNLLYTRSTPYVLTGAKCRGTYCQQTPFLCDYKPTVLYKIQSQVYAG